MDTMANNNHFSYTDPVWEVHRPYVEMLSRMSGSCIFVCELRHGPYYYLSPNFVNLGYDIPLGERSSDGWFLERRMHAEDLTVFQRILDRLVDEFLFSLPQEEQKEYKHIFEFRARGKNDEPVRVISQHQILDIGPDGQVILLGVIDLAPDQTPDIGLRFTLMNIRTGEIVPFDINNKPESSLTKREIEILEYIDRGMYSKEISERLSISVHTVNRHRQNILEKMSAGNTREAVNYARKLGLLS